jgi:hypothetical protein
MSIEKNLDKLKVRLGLAHVVLVGDRGMIINTESGPISA